MIEPNLGTLLTLPLNLRVLLLGIGRQAAGDQINKPADGERLEK